MHVKYAIEIDRKHRINLKNEKRHFRKSNVYIIHKMQMWLKKKYVFSNFYAMKAKKNHLQGD